jgi:FKBP-type peptidyl-prolyl cis-trans isomerase SlyD
MSNNNVGEGKVVSIAYTLTVDGQEIERADADNPVDYLHGAANIVPGLEEALNGRQIGERLNIVVTPDKGYGEYNNEEIERVARQDIPEADELRPGMTIEMEDEEGFIFDATVKEITNDAVVLDFNAPLAGKTLHFDVQIVDVREADEEELEHGHPHSMLDEDDWYDEDDDFDDEDDEA